MKDIKGTEALREQLAVFEQEVQASIAHELTRIGREVKMNEFSFSPFDDEIKYYVDSISLNNGSIICKTSFEDVSEKSLSSFISDNEIDHWRLIALFEMLKSISELKIYKLRGRNGNEDIAFTIADLLPVKRSTTYDYNQLVKLINNRDYVTDWEQPMEHEYDKLYRMDGNEKVDFFKIKGTEIIVMPGIYVYPTILTETEVNKLNS